MWILHWWYVGWWGVASRNRSARIHASLPVCGVVVLSTMPALRVVDRVTVARARLKLIGTVMHGISSLMVVLWPCYIIHYGIGGGSFLAAIGKVSIVWNIRSNVTIQVGEFIEGMAQRIGGSAKRVDCSIGDAREGEPTGQGVG